MYKDSQYAAICRHQELFQRAADAPSPRLLVALLGSRLARILGGAVVLVGAVLLVGDLFLGEDYGLYIVPAVWGFAGLTYFLTRTGCMALTRRWLRRQRRPTGDVFADLARLEAGGAVPPLLRRVQRLETPSFMVPVMALALFAPLSLHWLVGMLLFASSAQEYGRWIVASLVLVSHAHLTLLACAVIHVLRVRNNLDLEIPTNGMKKGFWALLWTMVASALPGGLLLFIPPIVVALTGVVFVPWMFHWVAQSGAWERGICEVYQPAPPEGGSPTENSSRTGQAARGPGRP